MIEYNPMSNDFKNECNRLGLTGRQLIAKYKREGKSIKKDGVYVRYKIPKNCCICKSRNTYIYPNGHEQWHTCECQKKICTGYLCENCYKIHDPNSNRNIMKSVANYRTGNQNPAHEITKAIKSQKLACILYGWTDLNKENDNSEVPIDCHNPKTGSYHQVQGRYYNSERGLWRSNDFKREQKKKFETIVCFYFSEDGKIVERIYKFPENVVKNKGSATIIKNPVKGAHWYEHYRITDEEKLMEANRIWTQILEDK